MNEITVLHANDPQCLDYSLYPLRFTKYSGLFKFTTEASFCLQEDTNEFLLIVRYLKKRHGQRPSNTELLGQLKDRYAKVFLFDDSDGADSVHFEFMDYVDAYYKKQILRDKKSYFKPTYRRQVFSDFYHRRYGVIDEREVIRTPLEDPAALDKLRIAWNIGLAHYPQPQCSEGLRESDRTRRSAHFGRPHVDLNSGVNPDQGPIESAGCKFIQARFGYEAYPKSIGYQRRLFLKLIRNKQGFQTEYLEKDAYSQDLRRAVAVLSPFGYGEICHRDFEAILARAVLIKPSMEHLETWPDVYVPDATYLKVQWDGSDLLDVCEGVLSGEGRCPGIAENALQLYKAGLASLDSRVEELVEHFHQSSHS